MEWAHFLLRTKSDLARLIEAVPGPSALELHAEKLPKGAMKVLSDLPIVQLEVHMAMLDAPSIASMLAGPWPHLEQLGLWFGLSGDPSLLGTLFSGNPVPRLRHLALHDTPWADDFIAAILDTPLLRRLESLDLPIDQIGEAGEAMLDRRADDFRHLLIFPSAGVETSQLFNHGRQLRSMGHAARALALLDRAIEIEPTADAHTERGMALDELGRGDEALACFAEATRIDPTYPIAFYNAIQLLRRLGRLEDALDRSREAIERFPDDIELLHLHGGVLIHLGREAEGRAALDRVRAHYANDPDDPDAVYELACIAAITGDLDAACDHLRRAIALDPEDALPRANEDLDLERLRRDPRFAQLLGSRS